MASQKTATTNEPRITAKDVQNYMKTAPLAALSTLLVEMEATIHARKEAEKDSIRAKLAEVAQQSGFNLDDFLNGKKRGPKGSGNVMYRNPADASQTWSGRGRKPKWLLEMGDEAAARIAPPSTNKDSGDDTSASASKAA